MAARSIAISSACSIDRFGWRTTRTASRCQKRSTAPRQRRAIVFGVIIGTGTGGGVVVDGRVLTGANAVAGEWGHNPLPAPRDDERPGTALLLRTLRLHRDFPLGAGTEPRLPRRHWPANRGDRHRRPRAVPAMATPSRCLQRYEERLARALGQRDQPPRSRRHRSWRRALQHRTPLRNGAGTVGAVCLLRSCRYRAGSGRSWRLERRPWSGWLWPVSAATSIAERPID